MYPNGISTSLPLKVQEEMVRTIEGYGKCEITVPGYAVEYDVVDTSRLTTSLESVDCQGLLFCRSSVNGTSGYEEAAGQGLVAGLNAALCILGRTRLCFHVEHHTLVYSLMIFCQTRRGRMAFYS